MGGVARINGIIFGHVRRIEALTASPCRSVGGRQALEGFVWMHVLTVILIVGFKRRLRGELTTL
jgi:hypothetical protein